MEDESNKNIPEMEGLAAQEFKMNPELKKQVEKWMLEKFDDMLQDRQREIDEANERAREFERKLIEAEKQILELQGANNDLMTFMRTAEDTVGSMARQIHNTQNELAKQNAVNNVLTGELDAAKDQVANLERELQFSDRKHTEQREANALLTTGFGNAKEEVGQLKGKLAKVEKLAETLAAENADRLLILHEFTVNMDSLKLGNNQLKKNAEEVKKENKKLVEKLEGAEAKIADLESKLKESQKLAALKESCKPSEDLQRVLEQNFSDVSDEEMEPEKE